MKDPFYAVAVDCLGQSGFRFQFGTLSVFIDPYLSDRVSATHGDDLRRMIAPPYRPEDAPEADLILITHIHEDHCDPDTLSPLSAGSPAARILCPAEVGRYLVSLGIDPERLVTAQEAWIRLDADTQVHPVPAAHVEPPLDADGRLRCVGYVIDHHGRRIYHAGDTSPHPTVFTALGELMPLDVAFLPVNERNYYRDQRGIIGNMSVREAFQMATDLGVNTLVPIHWDLFRPNSVSREELLLLCELLHPPFRMVLNPSDI
jgi:L-ascorbate metabolism protein UlaG (beta-lactamase superfamily)